MDYLPIPSAPGYLAGADGTIVGKRGFVLKPALSPNGYLHFRMSRPGYLPVTRPVHVAVCEAFHGPRPTGLEVAHENGVKEDNRASNLAWKTRAENAQDKIRHGVVPYGETHYAVKLSDLQVRMIREDTTSTSAALARRFGVSQPTVSNIRNGKTRKRARV